MLLPFFSKVFSGGKNKVFADQNTMNSVLNQFTINTLSENKNIVQTFGTASNTAVFEVGATGEVNCTGGGSTLISQKINGEMKYLSKVSASDTQQLMTKVSSMIDTTAEQLAKEKTTAFSGLFAKDSDNTLIQKTANDLKNIISQNITTTSLNEAISTIDLSNSATVIINGKYTGPCTIDQTILMSIQIAPVIESTTNAIMQADVTNQTTIDAIQSVTIENTTGLFGIGSIGIFLCVLLAIVMLAPSAPMIIGGVAGGKKGAMIGLLVGILCCVTCLLVFIFGFKAQGERYPWQAPCSEICKTNCAVDDKDCVPCVTCPAYCASTVCEKCKEGSKNCYTCAQCTAGCQTYCKDKCTDADGIHCVECKECLNGKEGFCSVSSCVPNAFLGQQSQQALRAQLRAQRTQAANDYVLSVIQGFERPTTMNYFS